MTVDRSWAVDAFTALNPGKICDEWLHCLVPEGPWWLLSQWLTWPQCGVLSCSLRQSGIRAEQVFKGRDWQMAVTLDEKISEWLSREETTSSWQCVDLWPRRLMTAPGGRSPQVRGGSSSDSQQPNLQTKEEKNIHICEMSTEHTSTKHTLKTALNNNSSQCIPGKKKHYKRIPLHCTIQNLHRQNSTLRMIKPSILKINFFPNAKHINQSLLYFLLFVISEVILMNKNIIGNILLLISRGKF